MLTFIYFQIEDTWHLRTFQAGNCRMAGRNAVQWYEEAKSMATSNHTIPALLRLQIATSSILRPAPFIQYRQEQEIIDLAKSVQKKVTQNHTLPLTLTKVSGAPAIYYIVPEFVQSELLPMVKYVSSNSLDDKDALQKEAEEMTRVLREMFPGIADYHEYIAFKAFSEPPTDPARTYKAYGITVKVDELDK
jgi:hypothetical protein